MITTEQIWNTLYLSKYKSYLSDLLVVKYQKYDRGINLFLAICSSSSIAAWAVWDEFSFFWSIIIVASQVITVLKPYFPHNKYYTEYNKRSVEFSLISTELEILFRQLATAETDIKRIRTIEFDFNNLLRRLNKADEMGTDVIILVSEEMRNAAEQSTIEYLSNYTI